MERAALRTVNEIVQIHAVETRFFAAKKAAATPPPIANSPLKPSSIPTMVGQPLSEISACTSGCISPTIKGNVAPATITKTAGRRGCIGSVLRRLLTLVDVNRRMQFASFTRLLNALTFGACPDLVRVILAVF